MTRCSPDEVEISQHSLGQPLLWGAHVPGPWDSWVPPPSPAQQVVPLRGVWGHSVSAVEAMLEQGPSRRLGARGVGLALRPQLHAFQPGGVGLGSPGAGGLNVPLEGVTPWVGHT